MARKTPKELLCTLVLRQEWNAGQNPWTMSCRLPSAPVSSAVATDILQGDVLKIMDERGTTQIGELHIDQPENFPHMLNHNLQDYLGNRRPEERFKGTHVTLLRGFTAA